VIVQSVLLCMLVAAPADEAPRLDAWLSALHKPKTVLAKFTQSKQHPAFQQPQISEGQVFLKRPDRLDFDYVRPHQVQLRLRGDRVQMHYPRSGRTQTLNLKDNPHLRVVVDTLAFFVRADRARLNRQYIARFEGQELVLTPKDPGLRAMVDQIRVRADLGRGILTRVQLVQADDSITTLSFTAAQINAPAPAAP